MIYKFSNEDLNNIINLYKNDIGCDTIGKKYNVNKNVINRLIKKYYKIRKTNNILDIDKHKNIVDDYLINNLTIVELKKKYMISYEQTRKILVKNSVNIIKSPYQYPIDSSYFNKIDNQDKSYILGFLMADGYHLEKTNTIVLSLHEKDKHILESIRILLKTTKQLSYIDMKKRFGNQWRLTICNKQISDDLKKHGIINNKTHITEWSKSINPSDEILTKSFIRGIFDGDGCITYSKEKYRCRCNITGNDILLNKIIDITNTYIPDIKWTITTRHNNSPNIITINITSMKYIKKFLEWIYNESNLKLKRKFQKYMEFYYVKYRQSPYIKKMVKKYT